MDRPDDLGQLDLPTPQRLAIISTPRSGNTWLRLLVSSIYGLGDLGDGQIAVHHPDDVDWANLPPRCVLQLHWPHTESFRKRLDDNGFQPIVIARQPLDVLLSILQFAPRDGKTARWLEGAGGDETSIYGELPSSEAFLRYATGPRARALLDVSRDWWDAPGVRRVRYEDLVRETVPRLRALLDGLAPYPPGSLLRAVEANAIQNLRAEHSTQMYHFWQGRPGLWRHLIPAPTVRAIREAQAPIFETIGHEAEPDESLTADAADALWYRIELDASRSQLDTIRKKQVAAESIRGEFKALQGEIEALRDLRHQVQAQLDATRDGWENDRHAFARACEGMDTERAGWLKDRDDLWNRLTFALERQAEVERKRDDMADRIRALEGELDDARTQRDDGIARARSAERERDESRARLQGVEASLTEAARRVAQADQELARAVDSAAGYRDQLAATQKQLRPYRLLDPLRLVNRLHELAAGLKRGLVSRPPEEFLQPRNRLRGPMSVGNRQESAPQVE